MYMKAFRAFEKLSKGHGSNDRDISSDLGASASGVVLC